MISTSLKNAIREAVQKRLPRAIKLRHRFHQIPEPSFEERATARLIAEELRQEGINLEEGLAQTGIVATVPGTRPGNVVALRADIDGLAIEENSSKPYASQNTGFAHSCGHDGHIVSALEASRILWELRDHLAGSVKRVNICMAMMDASLATPEKSGPFPATIPATCVPWSHADALGSLQFSPEPAAVDSVMPPGHREVAPALGTLEE